MNAHPKALAFVFALTAAFTSMGCAAEPGEELASAESMSTSEAPAARSEEKVYIAFAGYERRLMIDLARDLSSKGWDVVDAERGGERIEHIRGMNEIRFFHAEDAARANELAEAVSHVQKVRVLDFSETRLGPGIAQGQLEIWISDATPEK